MNRKSLDNVWGERGLIKRNGDYFRINLINTPSFILSQLKTIKPKNSDLDHMLKMNRRANSVSIVYNHLLYN